MKLALSLSLLLCLNALRAQEQRVRQSLRYLALGDSYTIGQSVALNDRWPMQLKDSLVARGTKFDLLKIIATTGWRTDNLINAMDAAKLDSSYNLVSILIGVNNQYQGASISKYVPDLVQIVNRAIALAGNDTAAVFLVSIPDYAYTPFGQGTFNPTKISAEIDIYNDLIDSVAKEYGIKYFYITAISRQGINDKDLVANDGLHPSAKMYTGFVTEILKSIVIESVQKVNENQQVDIKIIQHRDTLEVNSEETLFSIEMINMEGQPVLSILNLNDSQVLIPLNKIENGIYVLLLKNKELKTIGTKKIVLR